ncbi:unnamed protein product [Calypogeia fissa]
MNESQQIGKVDVGKHRKRLYYKRWTLKTGGASVLIGRIFEPRKRKLLEQVGLTGDKGYAKGEWNAT